MSEYSFSDQEEADWGNEEWFSEDLDDDQPELTRKLRIEDIWKMQMEMATQVADALAISSDLAFFWLNMEKWYKQELLNKFMNDSENFTRKFHPSSLKKRQVLCPLCTERAPGVDLGCGHGVCNDCFDQYINYKIADADIFNAICPANSECRRIIGPSLVQHMPNYKETSAQIFLRFQRRIKGCPTPDCQYYHELSDSFGQLDCECGATLCSHCGHYSHEPAQCELVEKWLKLLEDDKDTLLKVTSNTKTCPKCQVIIEKQVGCNHITCACSYEFCWQCSGEWLSYGHQCTRYQEPPAKKKSTEKRFAHYAPRYTANIAASRYHDSVNAQELCAARRLIAWTYVILFYMTHSNQRTLLEDNLVNLEQASERLMESMRKNTTSKDEISRLTNYVNERTVTLLKYTTSMKWKLESS